MTVSVPASCLVSPQGRSAAVVSEEALDGGLSMPKLRMG